MAPSTGLAGDEGVHAVGEQAQVRRDLFGVLTVGGDLIADVPMRKCLASSRRQGSDDVPPRREHLADDPCPLQAVALRDAFEVAEQASVE